MRHRWRRTQGADLIVPLVVALLVARADVRFRIIPNKLVLILAFWASVLYGAHTQGLLGFVVLPDAQEALVCCVLVLMCGISVEWVLRRARGYGAIGLGDVKYLAAWSLLLGWRALFAFSVSCLLGGLWALGHKQEHFALGPWISLCCSALWLAVQFKFFGISAMLL